jgi:hypothetical protein
MDAKEFVSAKQTLRDRLKVLQEELNHSLSDEYGIKVSSPNRRGRNAEGDAYAKWLKSHEPFHWFAEFYGIMISGGFDIIIGNPPYVELSDIVGQYSLRNLLLIETGNLYAVCVERFADLLRDRGRLGVIVPISSVSTPRMLPFMRFLSSRFSPVHFGNFAVRPGKLFVGVDMNLTVVVGHRARAKSTSTFLSTAYNRWGEEARPTLFETLEFNLSMMLDRSSAVPKLGSPIARDIFKRIGKQASFAR